MTTELTEIGRIINANPGQAFAYSAGVFFAGLFLGRYITLRSLKKKR